MKYDSHDMYEWQQKNQISGKEEVKEEYTKANTNRYRKEILIGLKALIREKLD